MNSDDPSISPASVTAVASNTDTSPETIGSSFPTPVAPEPAETRLLKQALFGPQGLRVGWSVALFLILTLLMMGLFGAGASLLVRKVLHFKEHGFTPLNAVLQEVIQFAGILGAAFVLSLIERRKILDYNLRGPRRGLHFLVGAGGGFLALSALVGALHWGGWLKFGAVSLSGAAILQFGALWGLSFFLTGLAEEGSVRCYLLFTLTRGINYWWALGMTASMSLSCLYFVHNEGAWGVYIMSALGLIPCLLLHLRRSQAAGFWQAAWVTSTFFGFIHTSNSGETWIGIFSAAAIGFVFCISIRVTGSAWWAIGFHAAWDWAQTFFYGTADSGFQPQGHFLTTNPAGQVFWSGGTDGPEGSVLVIPIVLLTLIALIVVYGRKPPALESPSTVAQPQLS